MRTLLLISGLALTLAACGNEHIAKPSDSYLACSPEPDVPAGDPVTGEITDEDNAHYLGALRDAGQDCRSKLQYVHDWVHKLPN